MGHSGFFIGEALLSATGGGATLAWQDMLGRVCRRRGGRSPSACARPAGSSPGFVGAALLLLWLKGRGAAAGDYLWPFVVGAIVYWMSWASSPSPASPAGPSRCRSAGPGANTTRKMFDILRTDGNFRTYVFVKCLLATTAIFNFGLFASYAVTEFHISKAVVAGLFTALALAARVVTAPLAGHAADRKGFKRTFLVGLVLGTGTLLVGLLLPYMGKYAVVGFAVIYPLNGIAGTTIWLADFNMVLEFGRMRTARATSPSPRQSPLRSHSPRARSRGSSWTSSATGR